MENVAHYMTSQLQQSPELRRALCNTFVESVHVKLPYK